MLRKYIEKDTAKAWNIVLTTSVILWTVYELIRLLAHYNVIPAIPDIINLVITISLCLIHLIGFLTVVAFTPKDLKETSAKIMLNTTLIIVILAGQTLR